MIPAWFSAGRLSAVRVRGFCLSLLLALAWPGNAFAASSPRVLLLDGAVIGEEIIAVGESGSILRSLDSGVSWTPVPAPTKATLTGVSFAPGTRRGWAVGHDALILLSDDGGRTWSKQWQGQDLEASFLDVCALSEDRVIAVGAYGLFMVSADGGRQWTARKIIEEDMHFNRITRGLDDTLYIAGEHGTLLRSTDRGESWQPLDAPYDGSFYGVLPLSPEVLLCYGLRGHVFHSADAGASWTSVTIPQPVLVATALHTRSEAVVLAGQARALFVSRTQGRTFAEWPLGFTSAVAELIEAPDGTVLALGEAGATRLEARESGDASLRSRPSADATR